MQQDGGQLPATFVMSQSPPRETGSDEKDAAPGRSPSSAMEPAQANSMQEPEESMPAPPPKLTTGAVDKRLRRVMAPKVDGSYKVPQQVIDEWKDLDTRDRLSGQRCENLPSLPKPLYPG